MLVLAAFEGALILCRTYRDLGPLVSAAIRVQSAADSGSTRISPAAADS